MNNENRQNEERMEDFESFFEESLQQYRPGEERLEEIKGLLILATKLKVWLICQNLTVLKLVMK